MENLEFIHRKEHDSSSEREQISLETALDIQMKTPILLAPERIRTLISVGNADAEEALISRFIEKYATEYNGLDRYVSDPKTPREVVERFQNDTYTTDDLQGYGAYIEAYSGPFFAHEGEVDDFLKLYVH